MRMCQRDGAFVFRGSLKERRVVMTWHGRQSRRGARLLVVGVLNLIHAARHTGDWMRRWQLPLIALFLVGCAQTGASSGANAPPAGTTAASPGFAIGTLVTVSATTMQLTVPGPDNLRLVLASNTQICRGSCAARWTDLRPGDRVTAGFSPDARGDRVARWVDANMLTQYGTITAMGRTTVTIVPNTGRDGDVERELVIVPETMIHYHDGTSETGAARHLAVGDHVYFTGTANRPDLRVRRVWAQRIDQMIAAPAPHP